MATKKLTGKEARYILKQHRVNLADLAQRLGIAPQSLNSRLNAETFSTSRQIEVNAALGMQIFEIDTPLEILEYCSGQTMKSNRPIFNYVKIMRRHADVAIRNVIDNIINPPTSSQTQEGKTNDI